MLPKKDEPLLIVKDQGESKALVLAVDGSMFVVRRKDLAEQPSGAPAIPTTVRNPHTTWGWVKSSVVKRDQKRVTPHAKATKKADACGGAILHRADRKIQKHREKPWTQQSQGYIERVSQQADAEIERKCGWKQVHALQDKIWSAVAADRLDRRAKHLRRIGPKVAAKLQ